MRIGFITGEYPPMHGGVGDFTRALAQELVAQGHTIFVLTDQRGQGEAVTNTVRHWGLQSLRIARNWAQVNQLDVVNIQFETAAYRMSPFVHLLPLALRGIPTFTTFHDLHVPYLFPKAGSLRWRILLLLARQSSGVIVTNAQDEQRLHAEKGIRRMIQIPIGSNIETQPPIDYDRVQWRAQQKIVSDAFLIGYFGFLHATKGIDTLLDGVALAIQKGLHAEVLMIGGNDAQNSVYAQRIERLGLQTRVQWTGYADEAQVSGHLLACDVIALPFKDGVSLRRGSFLAALAHGCPIITTTPAIPLPELDDCVYLIPPDSADDLAAALIALSCDPDARQRLGQNAKRQARQYSWESIAQRTAAYFETL